MAEELKLNLTDDQPDILPPIQLTPEMQAEMNADPMQPSGEMPLEQGITVEELARFLKLAYQAHGFTLTWVAQHKYRNAPSFVEIWQESDEFYAEVAAGIHPTVLGWVSRFPAAEMAVKAANATGFWGKLAWSYFSRWVVTYLQFRQLNAGTDQEQGGQTNVNVSSNAQQPEPKRQQPTGSDADEPAKRFVVDYTPS